MSQKIIAKVKNGRVLAICSLVTMETAFLEFTFVMEIMIVRTILMRISDINAIRENVMKLENSPAWQTKTGKKPNAFQSDGFVMEIRIVLMVLMRM